MAIERSIGIFVRKAAPQGDAWRWTSLPSG